MKFVFVVAVAAAAFLLAILESLPILEANTDAALDARRDAQLARALAELLEHAVLGRLWASLALSTPAVVAANAPSIEHDVLEQLHKKADCSFGLLGRSPAIAAAAAAGGEDEVRRRWRAAAPTAAAPTATG